MNFPPTPPRRTSPSRIMVELDKLHAKMEMQDKSSVEMSADSGVYDAKSEILTLKDNIVLNSSTGYRGPARARR